LDWNIIKPSWGLGSHEQLIITQSWRY